MIFIQKNGRITVPSHLLKTPHGVRATCGADILYSEETDEIAIDIYREPEVKSSWVGGYRSRRRAHDTLGASLYFDYSGSIEAGAYLAMFNFWKYEKHLKGVEDKVFDAKLQTFVPTIRRYQLEYTQIDTFIVIKLNPNNPKTGTPSNFKKLVTTRYRRSDEITLSKHGMLTLPKTQLAESIKRSPLNGEKPLDIIRQAKLKYSIQYDPTAKSFQLTFGDQGTHAVRKDGTIKIDTILKAHKITLPERLHLNFQFDQSTLTFALDDLSPDLCELRRVKQALGVLS